MTKCLSIRTQGRVVVDAAGKVTPVRRWNVYLCGRFQVEDIQGVRGNPDGFRCLGEVNTGQRASHRARSEVADEIAATFHGEIHHLPP